MQFEVDLTPPPHYSSSSSSSQLDPDQTRYSYHSYGYGTSQNSLDMVSVMAIPTLETLDVSGHYGIVEALHKAIQDPRGLYDNDGAVQQDVTRGKSKRKPNCSGTLKRLYCRGKFKVTCATKPATADRWSRPSPEVRS